MAILSAVVVTSAIQFARLQDEMAELKRGGPSIIEYKPRRSPGFHLVRRPETSLAGFAELDGPQTRIAQMTYQSRRGPYEMQPWLRGHTVLAPRSLAEVEETWRRRVLADFETADAHPALRPRAGQALADRVERAVSTPAHRYLFLFDPASDDALAPRDPIVLLPHPTHPRIVFVTTERRLSEIGDLLR